MRLLLLGGTRLEASGGQVVELKAKKCRALLTYLAVVPRHAETRERLAGLLWGGLGDERARANLRQCLTSVREALGEAAAALVSDGDQVRLDTAALGVDVDELRRAAAETDPVRWRRAAELYRGELAADLVVDEEPFAEWLAAERRDLQALAAGLWGRLYEAGRAAGDDGAAEGALVCWLAIEPASEEAHRALMRLYADTGRRAKALAQLERCKEALARAFAVEPDAETVALARAIAEAPAPAPPALPLPARPALAVLPFATPGATGEAWLGDGIAEEIIVALTRFERLMVIARQSSFQFRDRDADVRVIGRALGVHYVLSGTVRRVAGRLRLAVQLAETEGGSATWSQVFEIPAEEVLAAQDEIVQVIVATLAGRVEADRLERVRRGGPSHLEAYDCLLKGKAHHHRFTLEDNRAARAYLARAIELDPELAVAHAWMACVMAQSFMLRPPAPGEAEDAYGHVRRAATLQEDHSECHRVLASYYLVVKRFDDAERHQARALALNPNDDRIVCQQGEMLTFFGRAHDGLPWIERAIRLNPYHGDGFRADLGRALYHTEDLAGARRALLAIGAPRPPHLCYLAATSVRLGERRLGQLYAAECRRADPTLTPARLIESLPYRTPEAAGSLRADLEVAWGVS